MDEFTNEKEELRKQRHRIEERILELEKRQTKRSISDSLKKIEDISHALTNLQNSLNTIWKLNKHVEEDLKRVLEN